MIIAKNKRELFKENYVKGTKIDVTKTAENLKVSRKSIYNWMNEVNKSI